MKAEWLVAAGAFFFLLVAWILHLREDGFLGGGPRRAGKAKRVLVAIALALVAASVLLSLL